MIEVFKKFVQSLAVIILCSSTTQAKVKNVILLFADGVGPGQIGLLDTFKKNSRLAKDKVVYIGKAMEMASVGSVQTHAYKSLTVDSAAAASQVSTTVPTFGEMVGINHEGTPVTHLAELAKQHGLSVGLVSDTKMTHATPAGFIAHVAHRSLENTIANQILESDVDVLFSGGLSHFLPANAKGRSTHFRKLIPSHLKLKSKRKDNVDLLKRAQDKGYKLLFDRKELLHTKAGKVLGLFASSYIPFRIEERFVKKPVAPTLPDMAKKAVELLSRNQKGFFLMVEAGKVDTCAHNNDAGCMLHELLVYDETVGTLLKWVESRDDTLLVISSDHETGGFGFSYSMHNIPKPYKPKGKAFSRYQYKPRFDFGQPNVIDQIYKQKKTFYSIFAEFDKKKNKSPWSFVKTFNKYSEFKLSLDEGKRVFKTRKNPHRIPWHEQLKDRKIPLFHEYVNYFPLGKLNRSSIVAAVLAERQGLVWSTSTHTATPVHAIAIGPGQEKFRGLYHSTVLGKKLRAALGLNGSVKSKRIEKKRPAPTNEKPKGT